jgi:hypothetical protein
LPIGENITPVSPLSFFPSAENFTLASVLQNYRIRNISTEHTPPTPERISGAIIPFIDHDHITTLTPHNTPPETSFFEFSPRSIFLLGFKRIHPSISIHFGTFTDQKSPK